MLVVDGSDLAHRVPEDSLSDVRGDAQFLSVFSTMGPLLFRSIPPQGPGSRDAVRV